MSLYHITVEDDTHGNAPSKEQLNEVHKEFKKAVKIAKAKGEVPGVFVTSRRIQVVILPDLD